MANTDTSKEIADLNLTYMLLAQKLLREDKAAAMVRLGIGNELADLLAGMSLAETIRIASTNFMLCAFRLDEASVVKSVTQAERAPALQQAHLSILLAGARPQARAA
ncbi:flagellar transcriptional regulator FlhD [Ramlibacter sp. USB13]|uniref:Flagellar transcriptional regulator FlhD n=1 Tax=Ramlibacter cellulosilyticus TaxID=2764187 RepID=A0A923MVM3_9BURK|nr:flagellar transcriptional regulator FlhD [Ramlibacter cellulosilyticus]MBC5785985.1 flagellar transcriptional regulator FlhD [Ramlibacter cellulosilyticus]